MAGAEEKRKKETRLIEFDSVSLCLAIVLAELFIKMTLKELDDFERPRKYYQHYYDVWGYGAPFHNSFPAYR